jgi:hypothetical protein
MRRNSSQRAAFIKEVQPLIAGEEYRAAQKALNVGYAKCESIRLRLIGVSPDLPLAPDERAVMRDLFDRLDETQARVVDALQALDSLAYYGRR